MSIACLFIVILTLHGWQTESRAVMPADNSNGDDIRVHLNDIPNVRVDRSDYYNGVGQMNANDRHHNAMWHNTARSEIRVSAKSQISKAHTKSTRQKRQFDFTIDADHEDGLGTNLMASASANLFKNDRSRLDATARYRQHFSDVAGPGKSKIGGSLHFSHQY